VSPPRRRFILKKKSQKREKRAKKKKLRQSVAGETTTTTTIGPSFLFSFLPFPFAGLFRCCPCGLIRWMWKKYLKGKGMSDPLCWDPVMCCGILCVPQSSCRLFFRSCIRNREKGSPKVRADLVAG
jgi:hypothetical protein